MTKALSKFEEMRKIDVSEYVEKKGDLSYLSWAWALDQLLLLDADAAWEYGEEKVYPDGTVMVFCTVTAFGKARKSHLPVMDYKNQAIKNPNAFQINTAMQRCLVKAIAMHGLGLYIYAGEDLPEGVEKAQEITRENKIFQRDYFYELSKCKTENAVKELLEIWGKDVSLQPKPIQDAINDFTANRLAVIKNKGIIPAPKFGFVDVAEAVAFTKTMKEKLDLPADELQQWAYDNQDLIDAVDESLKAEKYKENGKTVGERFKEAFDKKVKE